MEIVRLDGTTIQRLPRMADPELHIVRTDGIRAARDVDGYISISGGGIVNISRRRARHTLKVAVVDICIIY